MIYTNSKLGVKLLSLDEDNLAKNPPKERGIYYDKEGNPSYYGIDVFMID